MVRKGGFDLGEGSCGFLFRIRVISRWRCCSFWVGGSDCRGARAIGGGAAESNDEARVEIGEEKVSFHVSPIGEGSVDGLSQGRISRSMTVGISSKGSGGSGSRSASRSSIGECEGLAEEKSEKVGEVTALVEEWRAETERERGWFGAVCG